MDQKDLVPVQLDLEIDGERVTDTFLWNIHEEEITPLEFAECLCRDLQVPSLHAKQIADQIVDRVMVASSTRSLDKSEENVHDTTIRNVLQDEYRSILQIGALVDRIAYSDQIEWDLSNPSNSPEQFAAQIVREMGIKNEYVPLIAYSIREQLEDIRNQCLSAGVKVAQSKAEMESKKHEDTPKKKIPMSTTVTSTSTAPPPKPVVVESPPKPELPPVKVDKEYMPNVNFVTGHFEFVLKSTDGIAVRLITDAPPKKLFNPLSGKYEFVEQDQDGYGLDVWFRSAAKYLHGEHSIQFAHGLILLKLHTDIDPSLMRDDRKKYCRQFRKYEERVKSGQTTWLPYKVEPLSMEASSAISKLLETVPVPVPMPNYVRYVVDDEDDLIDRRVTRSADATATSRYETFLMSSKLEELPDRLPDLSKNLKSVFRSEEASDFGPLLEKLSNDDIKSLDVKLGRLMRAKRRAGGVSSGALQLRSNSSLKRRINNGISTAWLNLPDASPQYMQESSEERAKRRKISEAEVPDSWTCSHCGCPWWATPTLRRNAEGVVSLCNACGLVPNLKRNVVPYWEGKTMADFPQSYRTKVGPAV